MFVMIYKEKKSLFHALLDLEILPVGSATCYKRHLYLT